MEFYQYMKDVREQLECNATDEYKEKYIVYTYSNELIDLHIEYFKKCLDNHLSAYKSLLFFNDYLNGNCVL